MFNTLLACVCISFIAAAALGAEVVVSAGKFDRSDSIVSFAAPPDFGTGPWQLKDDSGAISRLQMDGSQAVFILKELKAGQTKSFVLERETETAKGVEAAKAGSRVEVSIDGKKVLCYQADKSDLPKGYEPQFQRGGYIHPVFTPSGKMVTDDYPRNHKHHHGIWWAWTKTEFEGRHPDFWNMGGKTGTVEFVALDGMWSGPVHGGFKARHRFVDLVGGKDVLNEVWQVSVYHAGSSARIFDLVSTQECAGQSALVLPKYHYGGIGVRGHAQWDGKLNTFFLTSEGKDRSNGNETRGRWCHMGGKIDGELAGIAVLDHASNFTAPQPMRLNPSEPFFCYAPSQLGRWEIAPGKPYVSRYRFVVADGPVDKAMLERVSNDFSSPATVELK